MNITRINFINNIKAPSKSNLIHFRGSIGNDTFVKTQETESIDAQSFENFKKWAISNDFLSNANEIADDLSGNIIGSGFEGITYEIPNTDNWVMKRYKRSYFIQLQTEKPTIEEVKDIAPKLNIGQTIATVKIPAGNSDSSFQYWILKRQTGNSYGVSYDFSRNINEANVKTHLDSLKKAAALPQKAYDKCINDARYITEQGYAIDYCNPNNLMIDEDKQEIHFVDINDKHNGCKEQYAEILYLLLDSDFGINFNKNSTDICSKNESDELSKVIIQKFFKAMNKQNVKFDIDGATLAVMISMNMLNSVLKSNTKEEKFEELKEMNLA
ncbi:MAG: hypothetical protein LUH05_03855 [Candidatus Gastranaerophilales bacterium]|nr:hypothetical protein [Candidatus Gastranaerophilales bacterium]